MPSGYIRVHQMTVCSIPCVLYSMQDKEQPMEDRIGYAYTGYTYTFASSFIRPLT